MKQSQNWYIDSGASHLLTPDATNLTDASSSHGGENVFLTRFARSVVWFCFFSIQ